MLIRFFKKLGRIVWFLPGFLLWAAFPPMGEVFDCLFALAPLIWLSRQGDRRKSARCWFQSGVFFWVATLSWMPAIVKNGGPWPMVVLGWFVLAVYSALYFAAFGYLSASYWAWVGEKDRWRWMLLGLLFIEPVLWCGLELLRSRLFSGFAWNHLGVLPANAGFGQPAALGGVYLLSAVVIVVNGIFAGILERMVQMVRLKKVNRLRSLETMAGLIFVMSIYGAADLLKPAAPSSPRMLKVAMVQRNFPCCFKDQEENPLVVYDSLLSGVSMLEPDLVVLPESAMCEFGAIDSGNSMYFAKRISNVNKKAGILAGGSRETVSDVYNSAGLYTLSVAGDVSVDIYDKNHLVPFGEYIPGDKLITWLQQFAPVGSCTPGKPKLLKLDGDTPFGVAICFEDTDSALMRKFARMGAKFLVFITNDSWFSYSDEALQHSWQAVARAIETGLTVIRVGNNGVTGVIRPDGNISWLTGSDARPLVDKSSAMFDRIAIAGAGERPELSWYVRLGDIPLATLFILLIATMILVKYRISYEKRRNMSM